MKPPISKTKQGFMKDDDCDPNFLPDEQHMAKAIYLLVKAVALREQPGYGWPTIHACLRDAAGACESARQFYTKEAWQRLEQIRKTLEAPSDPSGLKRSDASGVSKKEVD